jgi:ketosteroid isomerase-like protein
MDFSILASLALLAIAGPQGHAGHDNSQTSGSASQMSEHIGHEEAKDAPVAVLGAYRTALMNRDAAAMRSLFTEDSLVVENGKVEGTFAEYMERHLGPELDAIKSFEFSDVDTQVTMLGEHTALGRETYRYRIELTDGRAIDRRGVATSVLRHEPGAAWQIVRYHSSSRAVN